MNIPSIDFSTFLTIIVTAFFAILTIIASIGLTTLKEKEIIYKRYNISKFLISVLIYLFFLIVFVSVIFYKSNDIEKFIAALISVLKQYYHTYIIKDLLYNFFPFYNHNISETFFENAIFSSCFYIGFIVFTFIFTNAFLFVQLDDNIYWISDAFKLNILFKVLSTIGIIINLLNNQLSLIVLSTLIRYYGSASKAYFGIIFIYFFLIFVFYIKIRIGLTIKKKSDDGAISSYRRKCSYKSDEVKTQNEKDDIDFLKVRSNLLFEKFSTDMYEELLSEYAGENKK